jgi:DNA polymerase III gamma/tau subunit
MQSQIRPENLDEFFPTVAGIELTDDVITQWSTAGLLIFEGDNGSGKTTLARIVANECTTLSSNIYEIDSKQDEGKVDYLRKLTSSLDVSIFNDDDNKTVIIIDEAHKLNPHSATALLKPVEDNMDNLLVILVTDQYENIDRALRDRGTKVSFRKLIGDDIKKFTDMMIHNYDFKINDDDYKTIISMGDTSPRNLMGILESASNGISLNINNDIIDITGIDPDSQAVKFIYTLINNKSSHKSVSRNLADLFRTGCSPDIFIKLLRSIIITVVRDYGTRYQYDAYSNALSMYESLEANNSKYPANVLCHVILKSLFNKDTIVPIVATKPTPTFTGRKTKSIV